MILEQLLENTLGKKQNTRSVAISNFLPTTPFYIAPADTIDV